MTVPDSAGQSGNASAGKAPRLRVDGTLQPWYATVYSSAPFYLDEILRRVASYDCLGSRTRSCTVFNDDWGVQFYDHDIPYIVKQTIFDLTKACTALSNDGIDEWLSRVAKPRKARRAQPRSRSYSRDLSVNDRPLGPFSCHALKGAYCLVPERTLTTAENQKLSGTSAI